MKGNNKICLLLEDDPEDKVFFMETLHSVSSRTGCYAASNGEEALGMLKKGIKPDLIFTDIDMPRMNGLEFVQTLKNMGEFRDIPVVVYSASYSPRNVLHMESLGVSAFYSKAQFHALPEILEMYFGAQTRDTCL